MRYAPKQHLMDRDFDSVEEQLKLIFYQIVFRPVAAVIQAFTVQPTEARKTLLNAAGSALSDGLRSGRIQYVDGIFSGQFSGAISRDLRTIGATFDKQQKVYKLSAGQVPGWVKADATVYQSKAKVAHKALTDKLNEMLRDINTSVDHHTVEPEEAIRRVQAGFKKTADALAVSPELSELGRQRLSAEYTNNMKLWIKKFAEKEIHDLRRIVDHNASQGFRFDKLIGQVKRRYGVTASKAKFLARQETALFMAKYREERFSAAGVVKYRWSTSHDSRVRHDHRELDKQIFAYKHPPVVDKNRGTRANPGQDYNCRCVDIAILEMNYAEAV